MVRLTGLKKAIPAVPEWQQLNLLFTILFAVMLLFLALAAVLVDRLGHRQVREITRHRTEIAATSFADRLASIDATTLEKTLHAIDDKRGLIPTLQLPEFRRFYDRDRGPGVEQQCFVTFRSSADILMEVCAAVSTRSRGHLYVVIQYEDKDVVPFDRRNQRSIINTDHFRVEILKGQAVAGRWLVALAPHPNALATEEQEVEPVAPGYQLESYLADQDWNPVETDGASKSAAGSLVERADLENGKRVFLLIDLAAAKLLSPGDAWPPPSSMFALNISRYDASLAQAGATPVVNSESSELASRADDQKQPVQRWYNSPRLHEQTNIVDSTGKAIWTGSDPSAAEEFKPAGSQSFRGLWIDEGDLVVEKEVQGRGYKVVMTVPGATATSEWNNFLPGMALGFALILILLLAAYFLLRYRVLLRIMNLAVAAKAASEKRVVRARLPYRRSVDEIGILSRAFMRLLQSDLRKRIEARRRMENERHILQVIGHHIRSPITTLMAIHAKGTKSHALLERMSLAIKAVYGAEIARNGLTEMYGNVVALELGEYLRQVAENAPLAGIPMVTFENLVDQVSVEVDSDALEEALIQVLNNAQRFRDPDSAIRILLRTQSSQAVISIQNRGPHIPEDKLKAIFEFGITFGANATRDNHGQGLFVARGFAARMGGTVTAANLDDGVTFDFLLPLAPDRPHKTN